MKTDLAFEPLQLVHAKGIIESFIYSCSHKLKSPLTSISGLLHLAEQSSTTGEIDKCLRMIQQCTTNMLDIVAKLEDYISVQSRDLFRESLDAEKVIEKTLREFDEEIRKKEVLIIKQVEQTCPWVSDKQCVPLILKNIVGNALQYCDDTKEERRIQVRVEITERYATIEVSDNGIGITTTEQGKIFNPFHQSTERSKGNGLGLFVVKGIVDRLKGNISVQSKDAIGTTVVIRLPNLKK